MHDKKNTYDAMIADNDAAAERLDQQEAQSTVEVDNKGLRYDDGKPEYHLLPMDGLQELGKVFTVGARKYAPRNWEKGMAWSRCYNSLMRHLFAFWNGEAKDPETGLHHMAHATWNAMALLVYSIRGIGVDDRAKIASDRQVGMTPELGIKYVPGGVHYASNSDLYAVRTIEAMRGKVTSISITGLATEKSIQQIQKENPLFVSDTEGNYSFVEVDKNVFVVIPFGWTWTDKSPHEAGDSVVLRDGEVVILLGQLTSLLWKATLADPKEKDHLKTLRTVLPVDIMCAVKRNSAEKAA